MEYRRMGNTGLQLSVLSLGSWLTFSKQIGDINAERLMSIAYENGINFFDNAEVYGHGTSEEMMGRIFKDKKWERSSYLISSKVFFGIHGSALNKPNQHGLCRKHIVEACNAALKRYEADYLDLYLCHRPDETVPIVEVVRTMNTLIQQGKILYWGTSEWSGAEIMEAHAVANQLNLEGPSLEQTQYNMFHRQKIELEYKSIYQNIGMGSTVFSPLASGVLTGKYNNGIPDGSRLSGFSWLQERELSEEKIQRVRKLTSVAEQLGISMATMALSWVLKNTNVTSAIVGATKENQLKENLKAVESYQKLTPEIMDTINAILDNQPVLTYTL